MICSKDKGKRAYAVMWDGHQCSTIEVMIVYVGSKHVSVDADNGERHCFKDARHKFHLTIHEAIDNAITYVANARESNMVDKLIALKNEAFEWGRLKGVIDGFTTACKQSKR